MSVPPNQSGRVVNVTDFWDPLGVLHPITVGFPALLITFVYLRLSSNRTLSPTTIWSHLCVITLSRLLTQPDFNLTRGVICLIVILGSEWMSSFFTSRAPASSYIFKSPPVLLAYRGVMDHKVMKANRVAESGIMQALRTSSYINLSQTEAIILEGNGTFSVIGLLEPGQTSESLDAVPGYKAKRGERDAREKDVERNMDSDRTLT